MRTFKASPTVPMPEHGFSTVRSLHLVTKMSCPEFRTFTATIRSRAQECLDYSGLVPVEEQPPAALRHFLEQVKKSIPTITKKYPYIWSVLAYLELYLDGRRRGYYLRNPGSITTSCSRFKSLCRDPIWIRFARSEKTGQSLQEISRRELESLPKPRSTRQRRTNCRQHRVRRLCKKELSIVTDSEVDTTITQSVDSNPAGHSNRYTAPIKQILESFCAHFVSG